MPFAICYNVPVKAKEDNKDDNDQDLDLLSAVFCLLLIVAFFAVATWLFARLGWNSKSCPLPWESRRVISRPPSR